MVKTVQTAGEPIRVLLSALEENAWHDYIERMEAGHSPTGRDEFLARLLASRELPPLPADYCWHLRQGELTIREVAH